MKLDVFEWFKERNPSLVYRDVQVVGKTEYSTIVFFNGFVDTIHLEGLKKSDHGLLRLHASLIAKVQGGYEVKLYVHKKVSTTEKLSIKTRDIDKVEIDE